MKLISFQNNPLSIKLTNSSEFYISRSTSEALLLVSCTIEFVIKSDGWDEFSGSIYIQGDVYS